MTLNIKNKETHQLARQLSELTGETLTEAVTEAVRERLERVRHQNSVSLAERLLQIGRDCAAHLQGTQTLDHGQMFYDKKGLPR